jgi:hypothetical protein
MSASPTGASVCPSAQPEWQGAIAFGIVGGTVSEPRVQYIDQAQPVTDELLALAAPVSPPEVFRFAAPCLNAGCAHFQSDRCTLVSRVVKLLPQVVDSLPRCAIRAACRWWRQEGTAACRRCPQVVTDNYIPSQEMRAAAQEPASR